LANIRASIREILEPLKENHRLKNIAAGAGQKRTLSYEREIDWNYAQRQISITGWRVAF